MTAKYAKIDRVDTCSLDAGFQQDPLGVQNFWNFHSIVIKQQ